MLHRINQPLCAAQLREVLEFQEKVLRLACTVPANVNEECLRQALGVEAGCWFWERLYHNQKPTELCISFEKLLNYVTQNPDAGKRIIAAFINDREFSMHTDDANYHFQQHTVLIDDDISAISPLMLAFYKTLFDGSGFPIATHRQTGGDKLTRDDWNEKFWEQNPNLHVCPACDRARPDRIHGKISSQVNHFFPKEKYPFFSVHPDNLVPVCSECNGPAQGPKDPIDDDDHQNVPLVHCFHPYFSPAIDYICVSGSIDEVGKLVITIHEKDGTVSKRVQNLVRILDLEARWADRTEYLINKIIGCSTDHTSTRDEVIQSIILHIEDEKKHIGQCANSYVFSQILKYLLTTPAELNKLVQVITSR